MSLVIPPLRATTSRLSTQNHYGSSRSRSPSRPSSSRQSSRSLPSSFIACHEEKIRSRAAAQESFSTLWSNRSAQLPGGGASQDVISERERRKEEKARRRRRTVDCSIDARNMVEERQVIGLGLDDGLLPEKRTGDVITVEEKVGASSRKKHKGKIGRLFSSQSWHDRRSRCSAWLARGSWR